jgi:hypothetical protein
MGSELENQGISVECIEGRFESIDNVVGKWQAF